MTFLIDGAQEWPMPDEAIDRLIAQFPHIDVEAELVKAQAWCEANAGRRKTARGMPRFLVNWLLRADALRLQLAKQHAERIRRLRAGL